MLPLALVTYTLPAFTRIKPAKPESKPWSILSSTEFSCVRLVVELLTITLGVPVKKNVSVVASIAWARSETTYLPLVCLARNLVLVNEVIDPGDAVILKSVWFTVLLLPLSKLTLSMETLAPPSISIPVVLLIIFVFDMDTFEALLRSPIFWPVMIGGDEADPVTLVPSALSDEPR